MLRRVNLQGKCGSPHKDVPIRSLRCRYGVMCCAEYNELTCSTMKDNAQRVTQLNLRGTEVGGDISLFASLSELKVLRLYYTRVVGQIGSLAGLTNLIYLNVEFTSVEGDVRLLAGLKQLKHLGLGGSNVHGDANALRRAIPGLDGSRWSAGENFTPCSDFIVRTGCPSGTKSVAMASSFIGADECVCCMLESSPFNRFRVPSTDVCVEPPTDKT